MRCVATAIVTLLIAAGPAAAEPIKFARYPHVSQGKLVFSYHGDIWIAGADGSDPRRLTAHDARDVYPRLSPDGQWVAFTSDRFGNDDVFVMPASGGEPRQLTFATVGDTVLNWMPDGQGILFSTSRAVSPWRSPLFVVPVDGGLPMPLPMDSGTRGMVSQDGTKIAFNRSGGSYWRKGYQGNRASSVWVQDLSSTDITRLTNTDLRDYRTFRYDVYPMWGEDGQVYFASERSGIFNIWRIDPDGGEPEMVTSHDADGVQFPSMSPDGTTIAYENEFEIWTLEVGSRTPTRVTIDLAFDPNLTPVTWAETENEMDGFDITPDGDYAAIDFHGELFLIPTDPDVGEKRQITNNSWRQRRANISPDGRFVAYTSDETKEEEIWIFDRETGERRQLTTYESFKTDGEWSPDAGRLAWTGNNRLFVTDVTSAQTSELAYNVAGGYTLRQFSPDGQWLVYDRRDEDQNWDVFLYDVDARTEVNVTPSLFEERQGTLTPDGTHVLFISDRNGTDQIWAAPLARQTEDPNDPVVRERRSRAGDDADADEATAQAPITVDTDGIDDRAVQITEGSQNVRSFFLSEDGETIYFLSSDDDGSALFSIGRDGDDRQRLVPGQFSGLTPTEDRSRIFYTQGGELYFMPLRGQRERTQVEFEVNVRIDRREEWAQIFDESWRVMKYRFYDPEMHGRDWDAIKARYEPLLRYVGENDDVYDLANEMIGELNASHTGVRGGPTTPQPSPYQTHYLGFEMMPKDGGYAVTHIYRDGPADEEWIDLSVGDYVTAIDGTPIEAGDNYWTLLNSPLNDYVTVSVASSPDGMEARDIRIRTVTSLQNIKYEEWVEKNREFVDEATDGQIAYVHIRAMNQPSLQRFETEINHYWNKKGIIVDIRYNGGGNIDQQLIDILERRPYEFWNSRYGAPTWGRRPRQAIAGPKVMLINMRSGSDSEVTPQAFRDLGLGHIVGNPTAAAVIATGSYGLIHGGTIRTPGSLVVTYDPERPNNHGINLENFGVIPDVWVENTPADELAGEDKELQAAVDEVMKMLAEGLWQYRGR